jgi:hypothetical protein
MYSLQETSDGSRQIIHIRTLPAVWLPKAYPLVGTEVSANHVGNASAHFPNRSRLELLQSLDQFEPGSRIERAQLTARQKRKRLKP